MNSEQSEYSWPFCSNDLESVPNSYCALLQSSWLSPAQSQLLIVDNQETTKTASANGNGK